MLLIEFDQNKPFALQVWCIVCFCISELTLLFSLHKYNSGGKGIWLAIMSAEIVWCKYLFFIIIDNMNVAPEKVHIVWTYVVLHGYLYIIMFRISKRVLCSFTACLI